MHGPGERLAYPTPFQITETADGHARAGGQVVLGQSGLEPKAAQQAENCSIRASTLPLSPGCLSILPVLSAGSA
jgi:hypothetical protein